MKTGRGTKKLAACLLAGCLLAGGTAGGASADDEYEDFLNGYGDDWFEEEYSDEYPEERYEEGYLGELSGDSGDEVIYFDEEIPYDEANAVTCSDDSLFAKAVPELSTTLPAGTVLKVRRLTGDLGGISATSAITRLNEQKPEYLSPYDEDNTLLFDVEFLRHRTDEKGNWVVRGEGEPESDLDYTADGVTYRMEEVWPDGYVDVSVTFYDMDPAVEASFTTDKPGVAAMHDDEENKVVLLRKSDLLPSDEESGEGLPGGDASGGGESGESLPDGNSSGESLPDGNSSGESLPDDVILFGSEEDVEKTDQQLSETVPEDTGKEGAESTPEANPEDAAAGDTETTPEPTSEATPEAALELTPEPTPEPTSEATSEATLELTPELTPEPTPEASSEANSEETPKEAPKGNTETLSDSSTGSTADNGDDKNTDKKRKKNTDSNAINNTERIIERSDAENTAGVPIGSEEDVNLEAWVDSLPGQAGETPVPEETPLPEKTPLPEETPVPEETPLPEETPVPEETPTPEKTPVPEKTPAAEETPAADKSAAKEGSAEIYINLNLVGRSIGEEDNFTFSLLADGSTAEDGSSVTTPMPDLSEVTAKSAEALSFGSIHFTKAGTYNYLVMENVPSGASFNSEGRFEKDGVVYDSGRHKVQIKVSETGGNKLLARVYYDEAEAGSLTFTNLYTANTPTIAAREVTAAPQVTSAPDKTEAAKAARAPRTSRNSLPVYLLFIGVGAAALIALLILMKTKDI